MVPASARFLVALLLSAPAEVPPLPSIDVEALSPAVREGMVAALSLARDQTRSAAASGQLAMLLQAHDQLASAAAAYDRARALDPSAFEWAYLSGVVQLRLGRPALALRALRDALERRPGSLPVRLRLGEALLASGSAREALEVHFAIVKEHPGVPQGHFGLGRARAALGDRAGAAEAYQQAVRLFPAYGAAHYALGLLLRDLGRTREAAEHLRLYQGHWVEAPPLEDEALESVQALKLGPDDVVEESLRLAQRGDVEGGIRLNERALQIDPALMRAHANLIALHGRARRWDKVEEQYRTASAVAPANVEVELNYAVALQEQGRRGEAMAALRRVLSASPLHAPAHNQLGLLLEADGALEEARAHYEKAVANQAAFRAARFNLGRVLVHLGRPAEAARQFEQILEPDDEETPRYLYALGAAWARAGDRAKAVRHLQDARAKAHARGQAELVASIERDLARLEPR